MPFGRFPAHSGNNNSGYSPSRNCNHQSSRVQEGCGSSLSALCAACQPWNHHGTNNMYGSNMCGSNMNGEHMMNGHGPMAQRPMCGPMHHHPMPAMNHMSTMPSRPHDFWHNAGNQQGNYYHPSGNYYNHNQHCGLFPYQQSGGERNSGDEGQCQYSQCQQGTYYGHHCQPSPMMMMRHLGGGRHPMTGPDMFGVGEVLAAKDKILRDMMMNQNNMMGADLMASPRDMMMRDMMMRMMPGGMGLMRPQGAMGAMVDMNEWENAVGRALENLASRVDQLQQTSHDELIDKLTRHSTEHPVNGSETYKAREGDKSVVYELTWKDGEVMDAKKVEQPTYEAAKAARAGRGKAYACEYECKAQGDGSQAPRFVKYDPTKVPVSASASAQIAEIAKEALRVRQELINEQRESLTARYARRDHQVGNNNADNNTDNNADKINTDKNNKAIKDNQSSSNQTSNPSNTNDNTTNGKTN